VLASLLPSQYALPGVEWDSFISTATALQTLTGALDVYYERYGHLPLRGYFRTAFGGFAEGGSNR